MKSKPAWEFLKETFIYDPDKRLTAEAALRHAWFLEEPRPRAKYECSALYLPDTSL